MVLTMDVAHRKGPRSFTGAANLGFEYVFAGAAYTTDSKYLFVIV
jgi:hypothetical protein